MPTTLQLQEYKTRLRRWAQLTITGLQVRLGVTIQILLTAVANKVSINRFRGVGGASIAEDNLKFGSWW